MAKTTPTNPPVSTYVRLPPPSGNDPLSNAKWSDAELQRVQASIGTIVNAILDLQNRVTALQSASTGSS